MGLPLSVNLSAAALEPVGFVELNPGSVRSVKIQPDAFKLSTLSCSVGLLLPSIKLALAAPPAALGLNISIFPVPEI
jgi:hypothetical protein